MAAQRINLLVAVCISASSLTAQNTTLSLPAVTAEQGQAVNFEMTVTDFDDINAISLVIDYDPTVLTFADIANEADGISFVANAQDGSLRLAWAGVSAVSLADGDTLVDLQFTYNGGISDLHFDSDESELNDPDGASIAVTYQNGRVSEAPTSVSGRAETMPEAFALQQNYPNPFNPETTIAYSLAEPAMVELAVFNLLGQEVAVLVQTRQEAGAYKIRWRGKDKSDVPVPSGLYLYRLQTPEFTAVKRMLFLK